MHSHHLGGGMQFHKTNYLLYRFIAKSFWVQIFTIIFPLMSNNQGKR